MRDSEWIVPQYLWPFTFEEFMVHCEWFYGLKGYVCIGIAEF